MKKLAITTILSLLLPLQIVNASEGQLPETPTETTTPTDPKPAPLKSMPLTELMKLKKAKFDNNSKDFDIFTSLFLDIWGMKPDSAVKVLSDGNVKLTAFIPTDAAFRKLVMDLTKKNITSEQGVKDAVLSLGLSTVEKVLLYHVHLGDPIDSYTALLANGVTLKMANKKNLLVKTTTTPSITLVDKNKKLKNAEMLLSNLDLNLGNKQVAHAIDRVLLYS